MIKVNQILTNKLFHFIATTVWQEQDPGPIHSSQELKYLSHNTLHFVYFQMKFDRDAK